MPTKYFDFKMIVAWAIFIIFILFFMKMGAKDTLDARLFYSGTEAAKFFKSLNDKETFHYLITEIFDLGFIATYSVILFLSFKRIFLKTPKIKYFAFIPGVFDFIETKSIIECLTADSDVYKNYQWLGYMTLLKWITLGLITTLFLIKFIKYSAIKFRRIN